MKKVINLIRYFIVLFLFEGLYTSLELELEHNQILIKQCKVYFLILHIKTKCNFPNKIHKSFILGHLVI